MTLPLPSGFTFDDDYEPHGPPAPRHVGFVIDSGRRKPVPRTLAQAFPQSEGYRIAAGRVDEQGKLLIADVLPPRGIRALVTADRVCWLIVLMLAARMVVWAVQHRPMP